VARAGWLTVRTGYELVVGDPAELCAAIRDVRAERLTLFRAAA
jgi:hypothetical protein